MEKGVCLDYILVDTILDSPPYPPPKQYQTPVTTPLLTQQRLPNLQHFLFVSALKWRGRGIGVLDLLFLILCSPASTLFSDSSTNMLLKCLQTGNQIPVERQPRVNLDPTGQTLA